MNTGIYIYTSEYHVESMAFLSVSSTVTQNSQRVQAKWLSSTLLPCRDWSTCSKLCDGGQRSRHSAGEIFGFDGLTALSLGKSSLIWCTVMCRAYRVVVRKGCFAEGLGRIKCDFGRIGDVHGTLKRTPRARKS